MGIAALSLGLPFFASDFFVYISASTLLVAAGATALNLVLGYAGILTMGQAAFLGLGGFTAGLSATQWDLPFPVAILLAAAISGVVGLAIGLISLRWKGLYIVLGSLALYFIAVYVFARVQNDTVGAIGFRLPTAKLFGFSLDSDFRWYYVMVVLFAGTVASVAMFTRSHLGRAWKALRHNPLGAATLGVSRTRETLIGFTVGSLLTGVVGAVGAYFLGAVSHETYTLELTIKYLSIVLIGGAGTLIGGLLGAAFYSWLPYLVNDLLASLPESWTEIQNNAFAIQSVVFGITVILILLFEPRGLAQIGVRVWRRIIRLSQHRRAEPTAISVAPIDHPVPATVAGASTPGLLLEGVDVVYKGTVHAVQGVSLVVPPGQVVGLVGANGAGKTSVLRAVTGFLGVEQAQARGRIELDGRSLRRMAPFRVARRGVILVPEQEKIFSELTVVENLRISPARSELFNTKEIREFFPALDKRWNERAGFLSGGERQMLAIARALLAGPKVLLVDELSQGVAPRVVEELTERLKMILENSGFSALIVDQNPDVIMEMAGRVYVMETGRIVRTGEAGELADRQELGAAYLGRGVVAEP